MRPRCAACRAMTSRASFQSALAGAARSRSTTALAIEPSGLRSSWPSIARNSSLARLVVVASATIACILAVRAAACASSRDRSRAPSSTNALMIVTAPASQARFTRASVWLTAAAGKAAATMPA